MVALMRPALHRWALEWWAGGHGAPGALLRAAAWPAEAAFGSIAAVRNAAYDRGWLPTTRAAIPVVSVGNLTVGGAGKTPFAAWLAAEVAGWGRAPAIVLRGYGGDEVQVHAELNPEVPVFVAPGRAEGVSEAARAGRDVAILDDAFQHRALSRDLDLVLVSTESWTAPRRLLPRGPWRESITALRRARVVVVTRKWATAEASSRIADDLGTLFPRSLIATCHLAMTEIAPLHPDGGAGPPLAALRERPVLAVASLGDPGSFARQLALLGARVELMAFPDHHAFSPSDARAMVQRAAGRPIVMTRKEAVKLRPLLPEHEPALVAGQRVVMESDAPAMLDAVREALSR